MGRRLDQGAVDSIRVGTTTRSQVVAKLGSPDQVMRDGSGHTTYIYQYMGAQMRPESFIPFVGGLLSGTNIQNQSVQVVFDESDIVRDYRSTAGSTETGVNLGASRRPVLNELDAAKRPR